MKWEKFREGSVTGKKGWSITHILHGITPQQRVTFIFTTMGISNLTRGTNVHWRLSIHEVQSLCTMKTHGERGCRAPLRATICPKFHGTALKMDLKLHVPSHPFLSYREFPRFCRWCLWGVDFQGGVSRSLNCSCYCEKVVNVW